MKQFHIYCNLVSCFYVLASLWNTRSTDLDLFNQSRSSFYLHAMLAKNPPHFLIGSDCCYRTGAVKVIHLETVWRQHSIYSTRADLRQPIWFLRRPRVTNIDIQFSIIYIRDIHWELICFLYFSISYNILDTDLYNNSISASYYIRYLLLIRKTKHKLLWGGLKKLLDAIVFPSLIWCYHWSNINNRKFDKCWVKKMIFHMIKTWYWEESRSTVEYIAENTQARVHSREYMAKNTWLRIHRQAYIGENKSSRIYSREYIGESKSSTIHRRELIVHNT